jgi:S1-C subfamily serine protease
VEVRTRDGVGAAALVKADPANDLVLLKVSGKFSPSPLAPSGSVRLGQPVFTIGFPNPDWQGLSPKLTRGEISSLMGMRDDPREFQISVATQPGNSGGPLLDERGNVVGVLAAQANEALILRATGTLPQNVNYAIKSAYAIALVESVPGLAAKLRTPLAKAAPFENVVERAQAAAVMILVY